jgi:uncharacterized membrane protein
VIKLGLAVWPSPFAAALIGYVVSSVVVVVTSRRRTGGWRPTLSRRAAAWFAGVGLCNGLAVLLMYAALARGPVSLVSPLVATYPLVTVAASALMLQAFQNQIRIAMGAALTVASRAWACFWWPERYCWSVIFSENRCPLFGIMRERRVSAVEIVHRGGRHLGERFQVWLEHALDLGPR